MVPKGWKRVPIKDVCESIIDCVNKTAPVVEYETPFKMIRTTNVRNGRVNTEDVRYVTEDTYLQWVRRGKPQVGDIIFTREAPVGEAGVLQDAEGIFLGQRTMMYRADTCLSDNYFLFYSLSSPFCQKQIEDFSNGGTVAHMRVPDCGEILINLPPFLEQKKIAQILSTWDKAISVTEKLLTNSQQQKKALMQQLLTGKKRLLDENEVRFSGKWNSCLVSDYFDVGSSKRVLQENWQTEGVPFYRTRELVSLSRNEPFRSEIFISDELFFEISQKYQTPKSGDFLVSGVGTLGIHYQVKSGDKFYFKDGNVLWFKLKDGIDSDYFKYCFQSDFIQDQIKAQASITTVGTYTIQNAKKTKFLCPPTFEEQQKIAAVLSAADAEISILKKKLTCLKDEKKALMQQLLTGKRRVKVDAEEAVSA
ncbi:restriction endonuclease subunit S [Citrobacter sp. Cpo030]|uniref:restriction endonuclease subunit S n=2 Tax=Citrobacter TaxID=544 RepID=UPI0025765A49|nr:MULTISPECIES: restriction endonuclease subunit S [Citrobacter]MDM2896157.1 restriction endonuclease subunit S [Citrobacter sp. Cpo030]MDN4386536.1 restriction endonuclease subunit S [Citrobacter portucalensis]MDN4403493.1 restriction endonuclease subunit S [Citrobacter portucalensis]MDN4446344.1 restriction endonuclease subunit S [Citrobacter portucalensis]